MSHSSQNRPPPRHRRAANHTQNPPVAPKVGALNNAQRSGNPHRNPADWRDTRPGSEMEIHPPRGGRTPWAAACGRVFSPRRWSQGLPVGDRLPVFLVFPLSSVTSRLLESHF